LLDNDAIIKRKPNPEMCPILPSLRAGPARASHFFFN
jgi:hypothetical protein